MELSNVSIGSTLEIYLKRDGYNYKIVTKVSYNDGKMIGVVPIASKTQLFKFKDDDKVDIVCRQGDDTSKWADVLPGFTTLEDGTKLHTFTPKKKPESSNRRMAFRLDMNMEITISYEKPIYKDENEHMLNGTKPAEKPDKALDADASLENALEKINEKYCELTAKAFLKDISESGAAISSDAILEKGDVVTFSFPLALESVNCKAVVVRVKNGAGKEFYEFYYGLSFVETSGNFVKAFFAEQRKSLTRKNVELEFK